ncbi:MAG: hypothetical protein MI919_32600 [Holophagales bacterium]|nr:hypothetical protein [Holophagales bacterium]
MIPGLTDELELWDDGLELLALRGVACVQPLILELTPVQRRRLAEGRDEQVFDALFHGRLDSRVERGFSGRAYGHGLQLFAERPHAGGVGLRKRSNRAIAAQLTLAGELWLRLDRSTTVGQGLLRAARGAESTHHDLAAIAREGNLDVIDWLTVLARELVEEWVESGAASLVAELRNEYLRVRPSNGAPGPPA